MSVYWRLLPWSFFFFKDSQQASKTTLLVFCFKMSKISNRKIIDKKIDAEEDFEARQNSLGFFNLLLQIDKRNNPQNYQKPKNNEDNRDTNNTNKA